ncbi:hypothetical protein PoB_007458500 [Plakobranchus ocellatus]|uniref:Uncharacterized protein n=1 Tax=Plakobranchus ocellatus TaxID=259542 RepID=A0AAV4DVP8_9GAST|nr:hypothetical protein PoB_007458500 [Plakobranchus ocellatus]
MILAKTLSDWNQIYIEPSLRHSRFLLKLLSLILLQASSLHRENVDDSPSKREEIEIQLERGERYLQLKREEREFELQLKREEAERVEKERETERRKEIELEKFWVQACGV